MRRRANGGGAGCAGVACEHTLGRQPLHLYGYLWAKPELVEDDKSGCFGFVVPDTVLFKQQKPVKWFFTSKQDKGKVQNDKRSAYYTVANASAYGGDDILAKSKKNVSLSHVLQAFTERKRPVARSTSWSQHKHPPTTTTAGYDENEIVATYTYPDRTSSGEPVMVVEHLTASGVQSLLTSREKPSISVLQRFVPTRSGYNHMIQAVFTPDNCLVRKCVNAHVVSDSRHCVAERTATFEADQRLVKPRDVNSSDQREKIEHMHLEMSNHLESLIGKPVARNVAYFKHGADDRIYLLWSTMLSFETGNLAFAKNLRLSLSHNDRLQHLVATVSAPRTQSHQTVSATMASTSRHVQIKTCPGCQTTMSRGLVEYCATFKAVIKAFEAETSGSLAQDVSCVPPLLESILTPMSDGRFKELCRDKEFLYRTVYLCQPCATEINSTKSVQGGTMRSTAATSQPHVKSERDKPIYMQSAHSIFWGRVEREEAARMRRSQARPISAVPARIPPRPTTPAATEKTPTWRGLTHTSWKRLLPELTSKTANVSGIMPKHCLHKLAHHLQDTFGNSSIRLALARTAVYPPTSTVSFDMLQGVCDAKLLSDVFAYWNEVSKANGDQLATTTMDLDALDAMVSFYVGCEERSSRGCELERNTQHPPSDEEVPTGGTSPHLNSPIALQTVSLLHPVPPHLSRASLVHRPSSIRSGKLVNRSATVSATQFNIPTEPFGQPPPRVPEPDTNGTNASRQPHRPSTDESDAYSTQTTKRTIISAAHRHRVELTLDDPSGVGKDEATASQNCISKDDTCCAPQPKEARNLGDDATVASFDRDGRYSAPDCDAYTRPVPEPAPGPADLLCLTADLPADVSLTDDERRVLTEALYR